MFAGSIKLGIVLILPSLKIELKSDNLLLSSKFSIVCLVVSLLYTCGYNTESLILLSVNANFT